MQTGFAPPPLREEPAGRAEPVPIPMKDGKTALLLGLLANAFDHRLALEFPLHYNHQAGSNLTVKGCTDYNLDSSNMLYA